MPLPDSAVIAAAVSAWRAGELVAFPTETVYGLGADAANPAAVGKIFAAKGRPTSHPLIVHLPAVDHLEQWAVDIPAAAWKLASAFWPGPLTLILRRAPWVPAVVSGGQESIGLRVPAHPLALALLQSYAAAGGGENGLSGIAAPSANRFGRLSPTDAAHVREELGDVVHVIVDGGRCSIGIESTIVDLTVPAGRPPRLLRPGQLSPEMIARVLDVAPCAPTANDATTPRVSGALAAHYAPQTPLQIIDGEQLSCTLNELLDQGKSCAVLCRQPQFVAPVGVAQRVLPDEPAAYAFGLYAALRELDGYGVDRILIEAIPASADWHAIADRLRRAEYGSAALIVSRANE